MDWKDTLLAGGSRKALPWVRGGPVLSGYAGDSNPDPNAAMNGTGGYQQRNDWVLGPGGRPVISGSSESQVGAGAPAPVPSPGFEPVDAGQYGTNPYFAGRPNASSASAIVDAVLNAAQQGAAPTVPAVPAAPWRSFEGSGQSTLATRPAGLDFRKRIAARQAPRVTPLLQSLVGRGAGGETQRILGLGGF